MKITLCGGVLMFAVCTLAFAQEDSAKDLKAVQGTWLGQIVEIGGVQPEQKVKDVQPKVVLKGDVYTVLVGDMKLDEGKFKLDASKKPKTIDAIPSIGKFKGMVQPGIYELKGDEMRVVFGKPGGERPKEFKTAKGSEEVLIEYKRAK